jgi:CRISPR-associated protein Csh2
MRLIRRMISMNNIKRQEFAFLYESNYANANGDPLNDNRPRIDDETGHQYITMYRIKRTVRDYLKLLQILNNEKNQKVLFEEEKYEKNGKKVLKTLEMRLSDQQAVTIEDITSHFIDIRLFGGVLAIKGNNHHLEGPIQISYGQSLHQVKEQEIQISAVMPSPGKDKGQGTLGISYVVPYALIGVDGSINQFNANKTNLTPKDVDIFFTALWEGTNDLRTTSKNQKSLFLIKVTFNENNELAHIGNLNKYLSLDTTKDDIELRSTKDYRIDITKLVEKLHNNDLKLEEVEITIDSNLQIIYQGNIIKDISTLIPKVKIQVI